MLASYIGVAIIGLLHGIEPGHGWPVALLYSTRRSRPLLDGFLSSSLISLAHLVSSLTMVVAYVLLSRWFNISASWIKYVATALLLLLAYRMFSEKVDDPKSHHGHMHEYLQRLEHAHEHEHPNGEKHSHGHQHAKRVLLSLWGLVSFAFILGFAHEEEFALMALVAGGVNPWILMIAYGLAVTLGLVGITLACVEAFKSVQSKIMHYESFIPRIAAIILVAMAVIIIVW